MTCDLWFVVCGLWCVVCGVCVTADLWVVCAGFGAGAGAGAVAVAVADTIAVAVVAVPDFPGKGVHLAFWG